MKKLMTLITAVALGGFAWAVESGEEQQETTPVFENSSYTIPAGYEEGTNLIVGVTDDGTANIFTQTTPLVQWWASNFPTNNTVEDMANYEQPAEVALATIGGVEKKYLKIEADTAAPMLRTLGPAEATKVNPNDNESTLYSVKYPKYDIGDLGIFVDANVSLSASEEPPQDFDGKIAVWLQVIPAEEATEENPDGFAGSTNLMVTCGALNDDFKVANTPTNIVISTDGVKVNPDEWHRITIRSIKEIKEGETVPGFVIYVDGKLATADDDYSLPSGLTDTAAVKFNNLHALFPSASKDETTAQTLDSVGFSGNGGLSKIDLTDAYNAPSFAQDPTSVRFVFDENVESITIGDVNIIADVEDDYVDFPITDFENATVAKIVYADGWRGKQVVKNSDNFFDSFSVNEDIDQATFVVTRFTEGGIVTIDSELDRDEAILFVNGEPVTTQGTYLSGILAYVNTLGEDDSVVITLGDAAKLGNIELPSCNYLDSFEGELTIDLHGNTIVSTYTVTGTEEDDPFVIMNTSGTLTIIDTVGGGKIVAATGMGCILNSLECTLGAVDPGKKEITYEGAIINSYLIHPQTQQEVIADLTILGGKFTEKATTGVEGHLDDGITLGTQADPLEWVAPEAPETFWTLKSKGATITKTGDESGFASVVLKTNDTVVAFGAKVVLGEEIVVTATLKDRYEFAEDQESQWVIGGDTATFTIDSVSTVEPIEITLPATERVFFSGGTGEETDPYQISVEQDLIDLRDWVGAGKATAGVYFEQKANIDMSATATDGWVGIGTLECKTDVAATFKGVYDGGNKEITNLTFSDNDYNGLFASAYGATIKNLKVAVAGIKGGGAAAFVGCAENCQLINLTSSGNIGTEAAPGTHTCAGIAVRFEGSTAVACTNKCEIWNNKGKLGGLFGIGQSATPDIIENCSNEGDIHNMKANIDGDCGVGGIFGCGYRNDTQKMTLRNCRSIAQVYTVEVTGQKDRIGSMIGRIEGNAATFEGKNITLDGMKVIGGSDNCGVTYGKSIGNGLVELCAASNFAAGETYKTMVANLTPAYTFTEAGSIAFNTNLYKAAAFNVTGNPAEKFDITSADAAGVVTFTAAIKNYTITFEANGGSGEQASMTYTWLEEKLAPACTFTAPANATFNCWSNTTDNSTFAVGATLDTDLGDYTLVADWTFAAGPDIPVDDDEPLTDKGMENATAAANAIKAGGETPAVWVEKVYGTGGKIPAAKLNAASPAAIALAVANDLPITAAEPKFAVSASTVSAGTDNVAAFEFTLMDGTTSVELKAITDKVKKMVRYTSALGTTTPFHEATTDEVAVNADPVNGKIKAELKQTAANAGFMKVEPQPAQ